MLDQFVSEGVLIPDSSRVLIASPLVIVNKEDGGNLHGGHYCEVKFYEKVDNL